jgi:hypothetical protein
MTITRYLPVRISLALAGLVLLSLPVLPAVAADEPAQTSASTDPVALYAQGTTWDQFLASARVQRDTWLKNAAREVPPGLVERFRNAGKDLRLLVITADWCPDSLHSVPYIAKLASGAGVELRVVDFRTGKAVMDTHRTPDGRASTPTVVLLRSGQEVAAWVERPASLQWWYLDMADKLSEEERLERKMSWYDWNRGTDALTEIVVLAEQSTKKTKPPARPYEKPAAVN